MCQDYKAAAAAAAAAAGSGGKKTKRGRRKIRTIKKVFVRKKQKRFKAAATRIIFPYHAATRLMLRN